MVATDPCGAGVISAEPVRIAEDQPCRVALAARSSPTLGGVAGAHLVGNRRGSGAVVSLALLAQHTPGGAGLASSQV